MLNRAPPKKLKDFQVRMGGGRSEETGPLLFGPIQLKFELNQKVKIRCKVWSLSVAADHLVVEPRD